MARITILLGSIALGGAQPATATLAAALADTGWDVDFVSLGDPATTGWPYVPRPRPLGSRFISGLAGLRRHLIARPPALLLSSLSIATLAAELIRPLTAGRWHHVAWVHGFPEQELSQFANPMRRMVQAMALRSVSRADHVIAVSAPLGDALLADSSVTSGRLSVIPNGPITLRDIEARSRPLDEPKRLVFAGRLAVDKAPLDVIDALAAIPAGDRPHLDILGDGPLRAAVEQRIAAHGLGDTVRLYGVVQNVQARLETAAAVVLPSPLEPFGNVVIEAFARGVPCIVRKGSRGPEALVPAEAQHCITTDGSIGALAQAISRCLAAPPAAEVLTQRARGFTAERHTAAMDTLLKRLAAPQM